MSMYFYRIRPSRTLPIALFLLVLYSAMQPTVSFGAAEDQEQELFLVAQKAFDDGFYDVAIRYIDQFLGQFPQTSRRTQAKLLLGQCYFFKGQYLKSFEVFQGLLSVNESKDATLYWLGETYFKGADYSQAEKHFRRVIELYPDSIYAPQAYYSLGWTFFEQKKYAPAQEFFFKLLRTYPLHQLSEDALLKIGECDYNLGKYEEAIRDFQDYLRRYPGSIKHDQIYFYIAESNYYQGLYKEAVEYYYKAAEISYNPILSVMAKVSQGWSYLKLKNYSQAETTFQDAQTLAEEKSISLDDIYLGKASLFTETKNYEKALEAYNQLVKRFPNSVRMAEAYLGKANTLYTLDKHPEAIEAYQQLIKQFESRSDSREIIEKAYFGLAWSYLKIGNIDRAIETFQTVENQTRSDVVKISALSQIGDAYQDAEQPAKALDVYDKILKEYPDSLYADYVQYRQGVALLKLDRVEAAILSLQGAIAKFPKSKYLNDVSYYLGVAYFKQGKWTNTQKQMESFLQNSPETHELLAEAHYMLALSAFNLNDPEKALTIFEKIVKAYLSETSVVRTAKFGIAQCLYKLNRVKDALRKLKNIVDEYPGSPVAQDSLLKLAEHHIEFSDFDTASQYLEKLIKEFPGSEKLGIARYQLGQIFETTGELGKAVDQYKLITAVPDRDIFIKAQLAIADIFAKQVDSPQAIDQYRKIAENSPEFKRDAYLKIAKIHHADKNYKAEIKAYEDSLRSDIGRSKITDAELQFYIGDTYESLNKSADAIEAYLKVPYLYSQNKLWVIKSYFRIARIFEDDDDWENARIIYNKILQHDTEERKYAQERLEWINANTQDGSN